MTKIIVKKKNESKNSQSNNYDFSVYKKSIEVVTKEYCLESSICGLKHLVNDKSTKCERWIWILTMIGALICSIALVWVTFDKYYTSPLVTTQKPEGISVNEIIFPAIGICSTNRISRKAVTAFARQLLQEERNKKYNESEMLTLMQGLGQMYNYNIELDIGDDLMRLHEALGVYDMKEILRDLTPRCEDLLLSCLWNEELKNCMELFDFRLTTNGYCCTFNYLRDSDDSFESNITRNVDMYDYGNKSAFDFDQGLKALIKFNKSDAFFRNINVHGAVLQFSDAYDFPDAPSGSFATQIINPNVQMSVSISSSLIEASRDIQHIAVQTRGCLFYDESVYLPFYTHSDCMLKCRTLFLIQMCKCVPFNIPKLSPFDKTCDLRDLPCLNTYFQQSITLRPEVDNPPPELELELAGGGIRCPMCYPTCSKTAYSYEYDNVNIYAEYLNVVPNKTRDEWLKGIEFTSNSIVHIRHAKEVADSYEQNVIMKWFDLFSNIGSTCGIVTGFSFVSVLEFLYYFIVKLPREMKERRRVRNQPHQNLYWNELMGNTQNEHNKY